MRAWSSLRAGAVPAAIRDAERAVWCIEAKHRSTSDIRRIRELDAPQTVEHRAGVDLDEG
jgi:hypothetical protein